MSGSISGAHLTLNVAGNVSSGCLFLTFVASISANQLAGNLMTPCSTMSLTASRP